MAAIEVEVRRHEHIDKALKKLKRKMNAEGILKEIKERRYFQKPSEKKREKAAQARSRRAKEERDRDRGIM
jgi:small subunit ribosomal protein S21